MSSIQVVIPNQLGKQREGCPARCLHWIHSWERMHTNSVLKLDAAFTLLSLGMQYVYPLFSIRQGHLFRVFAGACFCSRNCFLHIISLDFSIIIFTTCFLMSNCFLSDSGKSGCKLLMKLRFHMLHVCSLRELACDWFPVKTKKVSLKE